jgi:hypothetical protein
MKTRTTGISVVAETMLTTRVAFLERRKRLERKKGMRSRE